MEKKKFSVKIDGGPDFMKGMICPCCDNHNIFIGGSFGGIITSTNYHCECGFHAVLLVHRKGYGIEYKAIKEDDPQ